MSSKRFETDVSIVIAVAYALITLCALTIVTEKKERMNNDQRIEKIIRQMESKDGNTGHVG